MAQFVAYRNDVEGNITLLKAFYNADTRGKEKRIELFKRHGIDLNRQEVYPIQTILNYFKDLARELGDMNLFLVGRASAQAMPMPSVKNLKEIVEHANKMYHMMYTINGKPLYDASTDTYQEGIGSYTVSYFNEEEKEMHIIASTPFTPKSDEGLFTGLFEKFKPTYIQNIKINLDITKERRSLGGDSCTFIVTWS